MTAANGATTNYEYDALTRKLAEHSPDRGTWRWQCDVMNRVSSQTDERGIVVNYTYDALDRPKEQTVSPISQPVSIGRV